MYTAIRLATDGDADACGRICYEAFRAVSERYGSSAMFPSLDAATRRVGDFIRHPSIFGVLAETKGCIVGFGFLSERDPIRAVGPIAVDPARQGSGVGRQLMEALLDRARDARGVRLLQETSNVQSLSLYAALGFDVRETFVTLSGKPKTEPPTHWEVRPLNALDMAGCERLHESVHGHTRTNELRDALTTGAPIAVFRDARVRAYMAVPTTWMANHGVAETAEDMRGLLLGASHLVNQPISFLMPTRHAAMLRWCLMQGYRALRPMTLMTAGEYREPQGCYFPSVLY